MTPSVVEKRSRRVIKIDPITRLEGHGTISIFLNEEGAVERAYFQVPELRGFEEFCKGRPVESLPAIVTRLCGVCPAAHHLAAAKAADAVYAVDPPPTAKKLRELMYMAHFCHSHIAHFYLLAAPDFVCGPDASPAERNVLGVIAKVGREIGGAVIEQRSRAQRAQALLAGKATHMVWALPGGVSKGLSEEDRKTLQTWGAEMRDFAVYTMKLFRQLVLGNAVYKEMILSDPYALRVHDMGLVDGKGRVNFYDGTVRVTDPAGAEVVRYHPRDYLAHLAEHVESYSYLKYPYLKAKGWRGFEEGAGSGVYRATPLSRLNAADGMATPLAHEAYEEFYRTLGGKPVHATLATHWARLVELLYAAERWCELAADPEITGPEIRTIPDSVPTEGVGCVEAPRGTLIHHYVTDERGICTSVNLIVGTTNNNAAISMSIARAAHGLIAKGKPVTEGILNRIEMAFRAYDPCFSCATHSILGQMPLEVTVFDAQKVPVMTFGRGI
jgi:F420-non-reducing hydrogenase large subunit